MNPRPTESSQNPLRDLDEWDEDVRRRYSTRDKPRSSDRSMGSGNSDEFRDYGEGTRAGVCEFYRQNHTRQTIDFVRAARKKYLPPRNRQMGIWEAMD